MTRTRAGRRAISAAVEFFGVAGEDGVDVPGPFDDLVRAIQDVPGVQAGVVIPQEPGLDGVRQLAGHEDGGFHRFGLRQPPYTRLGSHSPICGNMYSRKMARIWIAMNGIIPRKIWFSVTCGGATPLR